jgi:hypothetical protein
MAYTERKSIKELAGTHGIHRLTATSLLSRRNVQLRQVGLCHDQVAEACRRYPEGWSVARLAERYGVDDMTVRRYLLQADVVMRSPHDRRNR